MPAVEQILSKYLKLFSGSKSVRAMTMISIVGIAIGVATLIVTYSVASGFGEQYRETIARFSADVVLMSMEEIKGVEENLQKLNEADRRSANRMTGVSPFLYREGLMIANGQIRGVVIKGVDPERVKTIGDIDVELTEISPSPQSSPRRGEEDYIPPIAIGSYLSKDLKVKTGDRVRLMLPGDLDSKDSAGRFREFQVSSIFESGMFDLDSQFVILELGLAQEMFGVPDTVTGIEIKLEDWKKAPEFALMLESEFEYPIYASHWQELNRSLFEAVKLEKIMFIIIMGALVIVAAFNIIGTVMLRILYKTSDISVLRALGMRIKKIKRVFVVQGLIVGFIGTLVGLIIAFLLIWSLREFKWIEIPEEIYLLKTLPVCISWRAVVMISAFSMIVCYLTSSVASGKVLGLSIVKGLHRP